MTSIIGTFGQIISKIIRWSALAICALVIIVMIGPLVMRVFGYRVNANSSEVATLAVKRGDVSLCESIISFGFLNPQSGESRSHCVYTYAKISHDPTVCELLMPSSYGFDCLGAATSNIPRPCTLAQGRIVEWGSYPANTHAQATLTECVSNSKKSMQANQCCTLSKIANLIGFDDCSVFSNDVPMHDLCLSELALKHGESDICSPITNLNLKNACVLRAKNKSVLDEFPKPIAISEIPSSKK